MTGQAAAPARPAVTAAVPGPAASTRDRTARALALQLGVVGLGFVSGAALARELGPVDRGAYQEVVLVYALAGPVLGLGVGSALTGRRSPAPRAAHLLAHHVTAWALGAVLVAVLLPLPTAVVVAVCLLLPGCLLSPLTEAALHRRGRAGQVQLARFLDVGGTSVAVVVLAAADRLSVLSATVALLGVTLVVRAGLAALLLPGPRGSDRAPGRLRVSPRVWAYDVVVACSGLADMLLAVAVLSRPEVGVYAVGHAVGRIALAPFSALAPTLTGLARSGAATPRLLLGTSGVAVGAGAVALGGFLLAGPPLVELVYGPAFGGAHRVAALLLLAAVLTGATTHLEAWALGAGGRALSALPRVLAAASMVPPALLLDMTAERLALLSLLGSAVLVSLTAARAARLRARDGAA